MSQIIKQIKPVFEEKISPVVELLHRLNISPNVITIIGLLLILTGSVFLYLKSFLLGGFFILLGNLCDAVDGALARKFRKESKFGAFIDSVSDRISDFLPLTALILLFRDNTPLLIISLTALLSSFLVSYIKARAEGLGISCNVGLFERAERSIILIIGIFSGFLEIAVSIIAVGSVVTAVQRLIHVYKNS
ncbi:CDP-alcohol phosphatidyltransferase family protein [Persephonella sp.]